MLRRVVGLYEFNELECVVFLELLLQEQSENIENTNTNGTANNCHPTTTDKISGELLHLLLIGLFVKNELNEDACMHLRKLQHLLPRIDIRSELNSPTISRLRLPRLVDIHRRIREVH